MKGIHSPLTGYYNRRSRGTLIAGFKASTIRRINALRNMPGKPVWQRDYYDRIVRDNHTLIYIRRYIRNNPINWITDRTNQLVDDSFASETVIIR